MKIEWKKTIKIAAILGSFAAIGALSIALVNSFTDPMIEKHKVEKEKKGLAKVFGSLGECDPEDKENIVSEEKTYLIAYYPVKDAEDESKTIGRIYSTRGTNAYGSVALLVGLTVEQSLYNLVVMENTESYAQTLVDNYLNPLVASSSKDEDLEKVKCGATYGAKLVRDMVNEAKEHYERTQEEKA